MAITANLQNLEIKYAFSENPPQDFLRSAAVTVIRPIVNSPNCILEITDTFFNSDGVRCIAGIRCRISATCKKDICGFNG